MLRKLVEGPCQRMTCVGMVLTMTIQTRSLLDSACQDVLRLVWDEEDDSVQSDEAFADTVVALIQLVFKSDLQHLSIDDIPREYWDGGTLSDVNLPELCYIFRALLDEDPVDVGIVIESTTVTEEKIEWLWCLPGATVRRSVVYLGFDDRIFGLEELRSVTFDRCEIRMEPIVEDGPRFRHCTFSLPWSEEPEQVDEALDVASVAPTSPDVVPTGGRRG